MADSTELIRSCGSIEQRTIYTPTEGNAYGCAKGQCKQALARDVVAPFLADGNVNDFADNLAAVEQRFTQKTDKLPELDKKTISELLNDVLEEQQDDDLQAERAAKSQRRRNMGRKQADDVVLYVNGNFIAGDLATVFTFDNTALSIISEDNSNKILTEFLRDTINNKLKKYGFRLKWIYVQEFGRLHFHAVIGVEPLPPDEMPKRRNKVVEDHKTQIAIVKRLLSEEWQYGFTHITRMRKLSKYNTALARYISKGFDDDSRPIYARRYHKSNNLLRIESETNDKEPHKLNRCKAAFEQGGVIAVKEYLERGLRDDGRRLMTDPEVCFNQDYPPYVRYFIVNGCPSFKDEIKETANVKPVGVDLHIRVGDARKGSHYVDSTMHTFEYNRTRGSHQTVADMAAKEQYKAYCKANPINYALENRYPYYGYGAYLLESWETPDTVDIDDLPRRREYCKALHDLDSNRTALTWAQNKPWGQWTVLGLGTVEHVLEHEPVFSFLDEWTVDRARKDHNLNTSQEQIYGMYKRDCEHNGEPIRSKVEFDDLLKERGITAVTLKDGRAGYTIDVTKAARAHFSRYSLK